MPAHALLPTLRPLLDALIDYAGLFPPAALSLAAAVEEYDRQRRGPYAFMLGRFVVPLARLEELAGAVSRLPQDGVPGPWPLSVLVAAEAPEIERLTAFDGAAAGLAIRSLELKAASAAGVARVAARLPRSRLPRCERYVEIPLDRDPEPLVAALGEHRLRAKIRTGGVVPGAFPSAASVARFLVAAAAARVPFKATAGLHHPLAGSYPLTYAPDSPSAPMFGFVNLFLAAAFARAGALAAGELAALLEERDAAAFTFDPETAGWRGRQLDRAALAAGRELAVSYGSCSFREPVTELEQLGLL